MLGNLSVDYLQDLIVKQNNAAHQADRWRLDQLAGLQNAYGHPRQLTTKEKNKIAMDDAERYFSKYLSTPPTEATP